MNRVAVLGIGCVLAFVPSVAFAALRVELPDKLDLLPGQTSFVDVMVEDVAPTENEQLAGYDLSFVLTKVSGNAPGAIKFVGTGTTGYAQLPPDNFVFNPADTELAIAPTRPVPSESAFVVAVINNADVGADVTGQKKIIRVPLAVDATALDAVYRLSLSPARTAFLSGDPEREVPELDIVITDTGTLAVVPEPASLSLLALGGLLALRRRRTV
jgi:hypothetical protein